MIQVVVDIRCTSKSGMGCYQLGTTIALQTLQGKYQPNQLTFVSDAKGFRQIAKLYPVRNQQLTINGRIAQLSDWAQFNDLNLTAQDFYIRIGMCGIEDFRTPLPEFKGEPPNVILISQPNYFLEIEDMDRILNRLPYGVYGRHLVGLNKSRCGIPKLQPRKSTPLNLPQPFALAYGNRHDQHTLSTTFVDFLRFTQLMDHTIKHIICIGNTAEMKQAIQAYQKKFPTRIAIYDDLTTPCLQKADIHIYTIDRVSPDKFNWLLVNSAPVIMTTGVMSVYEAIKHHKIVFNQHLEINRSFWLDLGSAFGQSFSQHPAKHADQSEAIGLLNYLYNPLAYRQEFDVNLARLKNKLFRKEFTDRLYQIIHQREGLLITHLQASLEPIKIEHEETERQQRKAAATLRQKYYSKLGIFRQTGQTVSIERDQDKVINQPSK